LILIIEKAGSHKLKQTELEKDVKQKPTRARTQRRATTFNNRNCMIINFEFEFIYIL
jgi:hypothetical protein